MASMNLLLVHKLNQYQVRVALSTTFAQLKEIAGSQTRIPPQHIKLLFRGRENTDAQMLFQAGVKDGAKISIAEKQSFVDEQAQRQAAQEQDALLQKQQAAAVQQEVKEQQLMKSQIRVIKLQIDQLAQQAQELQQQLQHQLPAVSHKAALQIGEVATQKLIQLDNVHVTGDARMLRKAEINRVNTMADQMELIKSQTRGQ
ncbi:hypothetical protein WJX82_001782 [Trebouxia sp. C0006]